MKYTILEGVSQLDSYGALSSLEEEVQDYLDLGWRPCGGVSTAHVITKEKRLGERLVTAGEYFTASQALTHDGDGQIPSEG